MNKSKLKMKVGISLACILFASVTVLVFQNHSNYINNLRHSASAEKGYYMKVVFSVVPGYDQDEIHLDMGSYQSDDKNDTQVAYTLTFEVFTDNSSRTTLRSEADYAAQELMNLEIKEYKHSVAFVTYGKDSSGLTVERGIEIGFVTDHNSTFVHSFLSKYNETGVYLFSSQGVIYNHDLGTARWEKSANSVLIDCTWDVSLVEVFYDHSLLSQYLTRF
ncbi:MAG: hypothetical protein ACFFE8_02625 [Candidatus Heimdallarchaeota archaeon]